MFHQLLEQMVRNKTSAAAIYLLERGRREGKAEGKTQGVLKVARYHVLQALECRFGRPSQDIVMQIKSISALPQLRALHRKAILTPEMEAFLETLDDSETETPTVLVQGMQKGHCQTQPSENHGTDAARKGQPLAADALPWAEFTRRGSPRETLDAAKMAAKATKLDFQRDILDVLADQAANVEKDPRVLEEVLEDLSRDTENPAVNLVLKQGRYEGRPDGRAEGALESARWDVLEVLECRFDQPPQEIVEKIKGITSLSTFKVLLREAALTPGIETFHGFLDDRLAGTPTGRPECGHKGDRRARPAKGSVRAVPPTWQAPTAGALPWPRWTRGGSIAGTSAATQTAQNAASRDYQHDLLVLLAIMTTRVEKDPDKVDETLVALLRSAPNRPMQFLLERGRKQGRAEGEVEGALEAARSDVLEILDCRFDQPPQKIVKRIKGITSLETLNALLRKAACTRGMKTFLESVDSCLAQTRTRLAKARHKGDPQTQPAEKHGRTTAHSGQVPTAAGFPRPGLTRQGPIGDTSSAPETGERALTPEEKRELLIFTALLASTRAENEAPEMLPDLLETLNQETENPVVLVPLERGRKRGRAEGKAEGVLEQARAGLLQVLECRFGRPSQDILERISSITTPEKLLALHEKAFLASGIEAFLKYLRVIESL